MVQPLMGKRLLPIYGGSAGTWLGTMVFFQLALLLGYGWATWLLTTRPAFQRRATLGLAGIALLTFRLPEPDTAAGGIPRIVWILAVHALPAMLLLFSVSPLMHGWLRRRGEQVPYHLYALSNFGSLAGLVSYPFLIEPAIGLGAQRWIIHAGIAAVTALIGTAIALEPATDGVSGAAAAPESEPETTRGQDRLAWVGLSLLTCLTMLGATELLAAELGSSPLAWVGPFAVYLLSFMVVFAGAGGNWLMPAATVGLILGLTGFMFEKGLSSLPLAGVGFFSLLLAVGSACCIGNLVLYRRRPRVRFDHYYLALATGGVAGGLLLSLVLPHVFPRPVEFLGGSALLYFMALGSRSAGRVWRIAGVLALGLPVGLAYRAAGLDEQYTGTRNFRNEYGHMMTRTISSQGQTKLELLSESTVHGSQLHLDPTSARRPTQYYTESGGMGRTILALQRSRPSLRIGVIGLGAGTLAAYGRAGDQIRFWDIDHKIIEIAQRDFTYLKDSAAKVDVAQEDGRRALATSTEDFDLIVVDAFSGDSVPAHLTTVEALRIYLARLAARRGILVIHASSRYNQPFDVLSNTALAAGRPAIGVTTLISGPGANADWDANSNECVIVPTREFLTAFTSVFPESEDNGRVTRKLLAPDSTVPDPKSVWTDDRNATVEMMNLGSFLSWRNRF
jgi:hypothetical protein